VNTKAEQIHASGGQAVADRRRNGGVVDKSGENVAGGQEQRDKLIRLTGGTARFRAVSS
jgi:hypothetical protein